MSLVNGINHVRVLYRADELGRLVILDHGGKEIFNLDISEDYTFRDIRKILKKYGFEPHESLWHHEQVNFKYEEWKGIQLDLVGPYGELSDSDIDL